MREFRYSTAEEAEAAFYSAFARASLEDMMRVWAEQAPLVCIHPMGPRLTDPAAIASSFQRIFQGGERMRIEATEVEVIGGTALATHSVCEHISLADGRHGRVWATNVYRLTDNGWRMVVHHGSPASDADPDQTQEDDEEEDDSPRHVH